MTASPTRSNDRLVWRALLVCLAIGLIVFLMLKVLAKPPVIVVDVPVITPEVVSKTPLAPATTQRAPAPPPEVEATKVLPTPPPPASRKPFDLVTGRVDGRKVGPIANAKVVLTVERGTELEHVGEVVTDTEGEFTFSSDPLAAAFGTDARLKIDVDAAGFQPGRGLYGLSTLSPTQGIKVIINLSFGSVVWGRVVTGKESPVEGAEVTLLAPHKSGSISTYVKVATTTSKLGGRFAIGFASSADYRITARADGVGTAVLEQVQLEAGVERELDDVALVGGPPIVGRVVSAGDEPVPHLELWAIDGNYANEVDALAKATLRIAQDERADGLSLTKAWTDSEGRFSLGGLRPGQYALRSPDRRVVIEPRQLRYEPGTNDVKLVVSSQRLIVRVMNAGQRALHGPTDFPSKAGLPALHAGVRITDLSTLPDGSYQVSNTRMQGVNDKTGLASFTLDPEAPVAVQAFDGGRVSAEEIVMLAQNEWTRELTLTLTDDAGKGRVRFDVLGEDGLPLTHLRIAALSSVTKIARDDLGELETDDNGVLKAHPAGSYHFVIGYAPGTDRDHFVVRTTEPVVVRANEETIVPLRARRGGRLRVALDLRGTPPPAYTDSSKLSPDERRDRFGARVTLTPAGGGAATALQFRSIVGPGLVASILPGETLLSDVLVERGTYDIAIESSAFTLASPLRAVVEPGAVPELVVAVTAR